MHGVVLAGGASKRFGSPKARHLVGGVPMAQRLARVLESLGLEVHMVVRDRSLEDLGLPLLLEPDDGPLHPLAGVVAALQEWPQVLLVPCDLPNLTAEGLARLAASPAPSVAWDGERLHPLVAHLDRSSLPAAQALLAQQGRVRSLATGAARVSLPPSWLMNLNAPPAAG